MAITKVYAKNHRLDVAIKYVLNGDKTDNQVLTARINIDKLYKMFISVRRKAEPSNEMVESDQIKNIVLSFKN